MNYAARARRLRTGGGLALCLLAVWALTGLAQQTNAPPDGEVNMLDVMKAPGKRLAEGKNTTPVGPLRVKTYCVDEIRLPKPIPVEKDGAKRPVDTVYRLTITGEGFPVRALLTVVWIGGKAHLEVHEAADLRSLSVILFDRADLKPGATLAVGYGEEEKDMLSTLPEKLEFKAKR